MPGGGAGVTNVKVRASHEPHSLLTTKEEHEGHEGNDDGGLSVTRFVIFVFLVVDRNDAAAGVYFSKYV